MSRRKWDENDVSNKSHMNREFAESSVRHAMEYLGDARKTERLKSQRCRWCYYFRSSVLCGQAFTKWACWVCDREEMHPNTAHPRLCDPCGKEHQLCVDCGGDVHMRIRRKGSLV